MSPLQCREVLTEPESSPPTIRLVESGGIRVSEIIAALSVALDITQGQPEGHCMRTALIGMRLAEELKLPTSQNSALFYALLLKDLGCSSNAAKIAYLFGADDHLVKRSARMIDWSKAGQSFRHAWRYCTPEGSTVDKLIKMAAMARAGSEGARQISEIRCERGADLARTLCLPDATADAIYHLDEHWNGSGYPRGLKREEIPLLGRICCLAQTVEIFFTAYGLESAIDVALQRRGQWFDPQLVDALVSFQSENEFWRRLTDVDLVVELGRWEPEDAVRIADEPWLDRMAEAFARVVDAKSPWTYRHSARVADIAGGIAAEFSCSPELLRDIRRAALLHDIGKLGVSNLILDKPGAITADERAQIRRHPEYSYLILRQVGAFERLAEVASAHHERLDGNGYHRGHSASELPWAARVLAVADLCEAMSAERPYRAAMPWSQVFELLSRDAGIGIDADCVAALVRWQERHALCSRVESQLDQVENLLAQI